MTFIKEKKIQSDSAVTGEAYTQVLCHKEQVELDRQSGIRWQLPERSKIMDFFFL